MRDLESPFPKFDRGGPVDEDGSDPSLVPKSLVMSYEDFRPIVMPSSETLEVRDAEL